MADEPIAADGYPAGTILSCPALACGARLYRLRTDDGQIIIIHNKGLGYPSENAGTRRYRLVPEFTVSAGKYDWLNKGVFISTLVTPVPAGMQLAKGSNENDRLIEIYRVL